MGKIKNSKDLIMLLLYAPGPSGKACYPIQGQTRLMKMVFLFQQELSRRLNLNQVIDEEAFPKFEAYDYGPYSADVYSDLEFLVNHGLVDTKLEGEPEILDEERREFDYWTATGNPDEDLDFNYIGREFYLTELGKEFVEEELLGADGITPEQLKVLEDFKTRCLETSLRSLLRYVYSNYEDMTTKSKIKNEVLQ